MRPIVARCLLVMVSTVLVALGVLAPLSGWSRAVLLVAACSCAVLDVLLVRSSRNAAPAAVVVVEPAPIEAVPHPRGAPVRTVVVGQGHDGRTVELEVVGRRTHIVVVGIGVLAHAVFRALSAQLHAHAHHHDLVVRSAVAPDVDDLNDEADGPDGRARHPPLTEGTAAVALDPSGTTPLTLVLVRGLGQLPRRWDLLVEVTRYGCSTRRPGDLHGTPLTPALPALGGEERAMSAGPA